MSDAAAAEGTAAPAEASPAPHGETAPTPSTAGGAVLGEGVKGRAAAIAKAAEVMRGATNDAIDQATRQAKEAADKGRAKAERERTAPERGEDGKFKPALSPADAEKQAAEPAKAPEKPKAEPAPADDDQSELDKLEEQWRKVRSSKKAAKAERRAAEEWRGEQARAKSEADADEKLKRETPSAWLEKHGFDFREVAKQSVAKVDKTPAEKAVEAALAEVNSLKAELKALRDGDNLKQEEARTKAALATLNREHAEAWEATGSDYPTLSENYEAQEILETITELRIDFFRRTNREAPISAVLSHMEKLAKAEKARFTKAAPAAKERTERATVAPKGAKPRAVVGPVTNKDAATAATPPAGLTPEERRARSTRMVAEGWRR